MVEADTDTPPTTCTTLDRAKRVLRVLKLTLGSVATALTIANCSGYSTEIERSDTLGGRTRYPPMCE